MLKNIIKNEILINILSSKFSIGFLLCFFLIIISITIRGFYYKKQLRIYYSNVKLHKRIAERNNSYSDLASNGIKIDRKPNPLSIFVEGVGRKIPSEIDLSPVNIKDERVGGNPLENIFRNLDFMFIIQIIGSIVAFLFSFNAISGEKEEGTLSLALSNPVSRITFILGKIIGNGVVLEIPILLTILISLIILQLQGIYFAQEDWIRLILIIIITLIYLFLFLQLGFLVSSCTRESSFSILSLLILWILIIFIVPNFSSLAASRIHEIPSKEKILEDKGSIIGVQWAIFSLKLKAYQKKTGHIAQLKTMRKWMAERDDGITRGIDRIEEKYMKKIDSQVKLAKNISMISPASTFNFLTSRIANTGLENMYRFNTYVSRYKSDFLDFAHGKIKLEPEIPDLSARLDLTGLPGFHYIPEDLDTSFRNCLLYILILLFEWLLLFLFTIIFFIKYDVRFQ